MTRLPRQLICFSYHKTGTSLFLHIMSKVCSELGLTLANHYGMVPRVDPESDVVLLPHSLVGRPPERPYRAIRLIRDPRDIWVSGYLYHLRTDEEWCVNADLDPTPPIGWPKVDYSVQYQDESWKCRYLDGLQGRSYQDNLRCRSRAEGLEFELAGYTNWTLGAMRLWRRNGIAAMDVKLEDVVANFDRTLSGVFRYFGFNSEQVEAALKVSETEDIQRMDDTAIANRPQIYSRTISKWRDILSPKQIAEFERCHGDLIQSLGYELATQPANTAPISVSNVETRLSVDGLKMRPMIGGSDVYYFIVPAGSRAIRLETPNVLDPSSGRRLGMCVREIVIRFAGEQIVLSADNPTLCVGWHEVERSGTMLYRWTDGLAELPWQLDWGPAILTVRYLAHGDAIEGID